MNADSVCLWRCVYSARLLEQTLIRYAKQTLIRYATYYRMPVA